MQTIFNTHINSSVRIRELRRSLKVSVKVQGILSMLDNRSDSRQLLGQVRNHAWMVGLETVSPLDLESVTDQIALKSTRDPVLELGAAARGVPSSKTRTTF